MGAYNRLKRLERKVNSGDFMDVIIWIRAGRFYDELTEDEQIRYCHYRYGEQFSEPPEQYISRVFKGFSFDPHFRLEYKPKPPTEREIRENVAFIRDYMERKKAEVNQH